MTNPLISERKPVNKLTLVTAAMIMGLSAAGCAARGPVGAVHVEQPGTHIVGSPGATSVVWVARNGTRVCTRSGPLGKGPRAKGKARRRGPSGHTGPIDTLLFRLCEARGNGDITAEQYTQAITILMKKMAKMTHKRHTGPRRGGSVGPRGPRDKRRGGHFSKRPWVRNEMIKKHRHRGSGDPDDAYADEKPKTPKAPTKK